MAVEMAIPQLGVTMAEGVLSNWLVEDGSAVVAGQPVYLLETDKTETEIEAPAAGIVRFRVAAGSTYPVGAVVAEIG